MAALAGCAHVPEAAPEPDRVGRIYSYVRSNRDGSEAERIHVFRASRTAIEVTKMRERCTSAAFVTADLDLERGYATRISGGRLLRDAQHNMLGLLLYHPASRRLTAIFQMPDGRLLNEELRVPEREWHLYDFDLASLTVTAQYRQNRRAAFSFGLPLILVGEGDGPALRYLGRADLRFVREESLDGRRALRFEALGPAFQGRGGPIWFDSAEGHILAAEWGIPNHSEYRDFTLRLTGVSDGGAEEWRHLLTAHFEGCPRR